MKHDTHDVDVAILPECPVCLLIKKPEISYRGHGKKRQTMYTVNRYLGPNYICKLKKDTMDVLGFFYV